MSLKDVNWKIHYRSSEDNLLEDFYIPALKKSVLYQRAAGFFSTSALVIAARGIVKLIQNGGKMELVVSPNFTEEDITAIEKGYKQKSEVIENALSRELKLIEQEFAIKRLEIVSWMVANNLLDIKIAIPMDAGVARRGIYHEKVGIFIDSNNDYITFSGSSNESESGYISNFESFDVHCSWNEGLSKELAAIKKKELHNLWISKTKNLEIISMPKAIESKIIKLRPKKEPVFDPEETKKEVSEKNRISIPENITLRKHQEKAITQWIENKGKGVLRHATGSGKTITALSIATKLLEKAEKLGIVVICPQKHIVDQWNREARKFGFEPILGYDDSTKWFKLMNNQISNFRTNIIKEFMFITTNAAFSMKKTQELLGKLTGSLLIIGDEVHNLGAKNLRECLPKNFCFRLGLSATPDRWYNEEGTQSIYDYFGKLLEPTYDIHQAIEDGHLCRYSYYPHLVELTYDEAEKYHELSTSISRFSNFQDSYREGAITGVLRFLLLERARLIGHASGKLEKIKKAALEYKDTFFNLFYCGDGKIEDERQIDIVCKILGSEATMKIDRFTAKENVEERRSLLHRFEHMELQGLVAIRCLDEGVDMPNIKRAFILASSTNPRQFIQRRGRVLRTSVDDKDKKAEIHDFIVVPPDIEKAKKQNPDVFNAERKLVEKELIRFAEFAETAENGPVARSQLLKVMQAYNLLHI